MEATFKIQSNEFDDSLIERIRSYINGSKDVEITVNIRSKKPQPPTQTREEYFAQLDRAIKEVESGKNLVSFTMAEFEALTK